MPNQPQVICRMETNCTVQVTVHYTRDDRCSPPIVAFETLRNRSGHLCRYSRYLRGLSERVSGFFQTLL
jgi:hypothetical protein